MDIQYISPDLKELSRRIRESYCSAADLSQDERRVSRFTAMKMLCSSTVLSPAQTQLAADLQECMAFAQEHGLPHEMVGWCLAAEQRLSVGHDDNYADAVIMEFLEKRVPPPASLLDIASGMGTRSIPLATQGYNISLLDPAVAFLETAYHELARKVSSLICGSFGDLAAIGSNSYDICLCIDSLLYLNPRSKAEEAISQIGRIASKAVVLSVESKHGLIARLKEEGFDQSPGTIEQIMTTGVTPPSCPENGRTVYSCFSSDELRSVIEKNGLTAEEIVGHGGDREQQMDAHPGLLALCTK